MPVRLETEESCLTAFLSGEIDHHAAKELRDEIDRHAAAQKPQKLLLNFREVTFMDSSGIGLVMGRYRLMQELGGELRVTGVPSHIRKVMRLSGLDKLAVMEAEPRQGTARGKAGLPAKGPAEDAGEPRKAALPDEPMKTLTVTVSVPPEELLTSHGGLPDIDTQRGKEQQTVG